MLQIMGLSSLSNEPTPTIFRRPIAEQCTAERRYGSFFATPCLWKIMGFVKSFEFGFLVIFVCMYVCVPVDVCRATDFTRDPIFMTFGTTKPTNAKTTQII